MSNPDSIDVAGILARHQKQHVPLGVDTRVEYFCPECTDSNFYRTVEWPCDAIKFARLAARLAEQLQEAKEALWFSKRGVPDHELGKLALVAMASDDCAELLAHPDVIALREMEVEDGA